MTLLLALLLLASPAPAPKPSRAALFQIKDGLAQPSAVWFDEKNDEYLISNLDGAPLGKDGKGFVSVLSPEGKLLNPRFIAGGEKGVTLHAPKGLLLFNDLLYVTDVDVVRSFERRTGKPKAELPVPGATDLTALAVVDGKLYVCDAGFKPGATPPAPPEPSETDAVFVLNGSKFVPVLKSPELDHPAGLLFDKPTSPLLIALGQHALLTVDPKAKKKDTLGAAPAASVEGGVPGDGALYLTSAAASTVFKGKPNAFTPWLEGVGAPGQPGFDTRRKRLLLPRTAEGTVEVYEAGAK